MLTSLGLMGGADGTINGYYFSGLHCISQPSGLGFQVKTNGGVLVHKIGTPSVGNLFSFLSI